MEKEFHVRLKNARIACGYKTKKEFAEKNGFEEKTYQHWESGKVTPSFENLIKLVDALGISIDELIGHDIPARWMEKIIYEKTGLTVEQIEMLKEFADTLGIRIDTEDDPEIMDKMIDELISRKIGVPVETIQRLKRIIKKGELKTLDAFMLYIDGDNVSIINN